MKKILLQFFCFVVPVLSSFSGFTQITQTFITSGTWVCPDNVLMVTVECWGAGGGGGGTNLSLSSGGGGAGGSYSRSTIAVSPGLSYNYVVGAGGTGSLTDGGTGGGSWFSSNATVFAGGGTGGNAGSSITLLGSGGIASSNANIGATIFTGGSGAVGVAGAYGGSGGGAAGNAGNGGTPIVVAGLPVGGAGGNVGGGTGAATASILVGGNGIAGAAPGGGGSGGYNLFALFSPPARTGGNGGNGQIIITYTPSVPTPIFIEYFSCKGKENGNYVNYKLNVMDEHELYLVLERSNDGKSFMAIKEQILRQADCTQPFEYVDKKVNSKSSYYRLKIINKKGRVDFSKIEEVNNAVSELKSITFGPNPVMDFLKLNIEATSGESINIAITDLSGKELRKKNANILEGNNAFEINLSGLHSGNYIIRIMGDNRRSQAFRFVKN